MNGSHNNSCGFVILDSGREVEVRGDIPTEQLVPRWRFLQTVMPLPSGDVDQWIPYSFVFQSYPPGLRGDPLRRLIQRPIDVRLAAGRAVRGLRCPNRRL